MFDVAAPVGYTQTSRKSSEISSDVQSIPTENNGKILFFCFLGV